MRLWTIHPKYLDSRGLVALWREGLLARQVLRGKTKGYRNHPQLGRFREHSRPVGMMTRYLLAVHDESKVRKYNFDRSKAGRATVGDRAAGGDRITESEGQLLFEWSHFMKKLRKRNPRLYRRYRGLKRPDPHPLFRIIDGGVNPWERIGGRTTPAALGDRRRRIAGVRPRGLIREGTATHRKRPYH